MREIKFRGHDGLEWIYSNSIDYELETNICRILDYKYDEWMIVHKVGQYTGLKTKSGTEIYEGDILTLQAHTECFVEFYNGGFIARSTDKVQRINWSPISLSSLIEYGYEVTSNIYEKPMEE